jgi:ATP-dependent DNA ligase
VRAEGDGATVFANACALGCECIVSKRKGSRYSSAYWLKTKNPDQEPRRDRGRAACRGGLVMTDQRRNRCR